MKINKTSNAFTLIELLVVIAIIAILASIALPVFSSVQERGKQTKDLSNGKQIVLALKQFALDNNGDFPNRQYGTGTPGSDYASSTLFTTDNLPAGGGTASSNGAFRWLLPTYTRSEGIFAVPGSNWNAVGPNEILDAVYGTPIAGGTLAAGECGYSYVTGLNDTSNPSFPLVTDGWNVATIGDYTNVKSANGGVWGGQRAVVILVDGSGQVMRCNDQADPVNAFVSRPAHAYNIVDNAASTGPDPWLTATNFRLNPD
jgi:prepilin-type N-terminal cleavage/methylation domain-containing protein